ncbi:hypothetical protein [Nocardia wallacei]|uniref:hypothetical protein n=1 Tax=Nocardia wallacei TaxID=480035 RepID=UPI002455E364|nr:hypothetical protein [Nocardia wallacei]
MPTNSPGPVRAPRQTREIARWLRRNWRHHSTSGARAADFAVLSRWKTGAPVSHDGPYLMSITQYTPGRLTDVGDIWRLSERLGDELIGIEGAVAVMTYIQPARRRLGSVSAWTDRRGLTTFVALPTHVETMRKYRPRGLPLRSATWWDDEYPGDSALSRGLRLLDSSPERRIAIPAPGRV